MQAHPISLATTLGISVDLFSCSYLDVSVRHVRPACLCIQHAVTLAGRVSPFGNLRIKARLLAPRSLSQATTSFIACNRQGIHHVHLFTCPYNVGLCMSYKERHRTRVSAYFICDTYRFSTLSVQPTFVSYTLKENFTSSRFLKNENYTYRNSASWAWINAV